MIGAALVTAMAPAAALAAPPAPTLTPDIASAINTTPTITLSAAGALAYRWQIDGGAPAFTPTISLAGLADGSHTLVVTAFDLFGGASPQTARTFVLDRRAPTAPTITPSLPSVTNTPPTTVTLGGGGEPVTYRWQLDGGSVQSGPTVTLGNVTDGAHTLSAWAVDAAGNESPRTTQTMQVSRAPQALTPPNVTPEISSTTPVAALPTITLSGGGRATGYQWQIDQGPVRTGQVVTAPGLATGQHTLTVWSLDASGAISTKVTRTFRVDQSAPTAPQISSTIGVLGRAPTVTIAMPGASILWSLTGPRALSGEAASPATPALGTLTDGTYALSARARSASGATSPTSTITFRIDTKAPVAPSITSGPASANGGPNPAFTWVGEPGATYVWRITRGELIVQGPTPTTEGRIKTRPIRAGGEYTFSVYAIDAAGNAGLPASWRFSLRDRITAGVTGTPGVQALLSRGYGPVYPRAGRNFLRRSGISLHWVYNAGRPARIFNVQVFNERGKKIFSAFPKKSHIVLPARVTQPGHRYYWQVWPYWGKRLGGYSREPLGISFFTVNPAAALAAERTAR